MSVILILILENYKDYIELHSNIVVKALFYKPKDHGLETR
jgi:hypothetical protein